MASPTIESLCCLSTRTKFVNQFLVDFRSIQYNLVSIFAAALGIGGALYQILRQENLDVYQRRSITSHMLRTRGRYIIKWLALADFMAALGILIRSISWLTDQTFGTSDGNDIVGQIFCIVTSGWIHYFYTATYFWTLIYAIDVKFLIQDQIFNFKMYHVIAWSVPAILCTTGLLFLYLPDLNCHSYEVNPFLRFLPNYLSTFIPILFVMIANPILYMIAFTSVERLLAATRGRFTQTERKIVQSLKSKFLLINAIYYLCWLPNILNGIILWTSWESLPKVAIVTIWYLMAILNPLQAVFSCVVYRNWNNGNKIRRPSWIHPKLWFSDTTTPSPNSSSANNYFISNSSEEVKFDTSKGDGASLSQISFHMQVPSEMTPLLSSNRGTVVLGEQNETPENSVIAYKYS